MDPEIPEVAEEPLILLPCASCSRTFRPEALAKHSKVCEKTLMKKRKQFDSAKQRLQGTEIEHFATQPTVKSIRKKDPLHTPNKSRQKEKIDIAKSIQVAKKPLETPSSMQIKPSDHEECPFCGRSFGPKAFERHTEFCKEQHQKLKLTPNVSNEAKERLKVRTSYRGPLTNKVLNRDRYQPNRNRDPSPSMGSSLTELRDEEVKGKGLMRNGSLRSSLRSRPRDVTPPPLRRTMTQISPSRNTKANRDLFNESLEKSQQASIKNHSTPRLYSRESTERKDAEKYNPYLSAERQMQELFGGDDTMPKAVLPEIPHTSPIQSSPTSAFVKYSSPKRSSSVENLKYENKENNNDPLLAIGTTLENKIDSNRNFSLSNISLCSVVSIDSLDCNKNSLSSQLLNSHLDSFQRSYSAVEPKSTRSHNKTKVNLQEMLYGSQSPDHATRSESSSSDAGNLEACEAELLISMLEFEKMLKSSPEPSSQSSLPSSESHQRLSESSNHDEEHQKNQRNLSTVDSAYSSLTRSVGAEGDKKTGKPLTDAPKFCHECGSMYPVAQAKFCCNCGVRRIVL